MGFWGDVEGFGKELWSPIKSIYSPTQVSPPSTGPGTPQDIANTDQANANAIFAQLYPSLVNTVTNPNAPSVAQSQLAEGVGATTGAANAMAAGQTGENAALSHIQAMRSAEAAQTAQNQQQALVRADEVAKAQGGLGNLLGMQTNAGLQGAEAQQAAAQAAKTANASTNTLLGRLGVTSISNGLAGGSSGGGGGSSAPAAGSDPDALATW